jgi:hypothetical protein
MRLDQARQLPKAAQQEDRGVMSKAETLEARQMKMAVTMN